MSTEKIKYLFCLYWLTEKNNKTETITVFIDKKSFVTTKRAYDELEKDGFIYTIQAKGCYVAPKNVELLREENLRKVEVCSISRMSFIVVLLPAPFGPTYPMI